MCISSRIYVVWWLSVERLVGEEVDEHLQCQARLVRGHHMACTLGDTNINATIVKTLKCTNLFQITNRHYIVLKKLLLSACAEALLTKHPAIQLSVFFSLFYSVSGPGKLNVLLLLLKQIITQIQLFKLFEQG